MEMIRSGVLLLSRGFRRGWRQDIALVSTLFICTAPGRAFLGRLLQQERRAALWTLFDHRLVPIDDFTLGILGAAVKDLASLRSFDDDFAFTAGPRTGHTGSLAFDVLTLRIIRARDEFPKPSLAFHQLSVINRTLFIKDFRWGRDLAAFGNLADVATVGIPRATIERSEPAPLQLHLLAAQFTCLGFFSDLAIP